MSQYHVQASYDWDAGVWYVSESTIPGLHVESSDIQEFVSICLKLVPQLLKADTSGSSVKDSLSNDPPELLISADTDFHKQVALA